MSVFSITPGAVTRSMQYVTGRAAAGSLVSVTALADTTLGDAPEVTLEPRTGAAFGAVINTHKASHAKYLKVTVTEQVAGQTPHDATGHLFVPAQPEGFGYDHDGNLTVDGRWSYAWDAENRLLRMETRTGLDAAGPDPLPLERLTFTYDAFGRRTGKRVEKMVATNWQVR